MQATSPAALVLFRSLMEAEEQACDALATRITEDPAALASALLRVHQLTPHGAGDDAGIHARARAAVLERGQEASIRRRVTALLDRSPPEEVPRLAQVVAAGALLAMLWAVA